MRPPMNGFITNFYMFSMSASHSIELFIGQCNLLLYVLSTYRLNRLFECTFSSLITSTHASRMSVSRARFSNRLGSRNVFRGGGALGHGPTFLTLPFSEKEQN